VSPPLSTEWQALRLEYISPSSLPQCSPLSIALLYLLFWFLMDVFVAVWVFSVKTD
jgi:hypothetical protein